MRVLFVLMILAGSAWAQVSTVTSLGNTAFTSGAQGLPSDADVAQVLRALTILRGSPAVVPLTEVNNVPVNTFDPNFVPPATFVEQEPNAVPLPPQSSRGVRRSAPYGSLTTPKNIRGF